MSGTSALLGALGLVLLGFGLLSAILVPFQPATNLSWSWVLGNLLLGAVFLAASVVSSIDTVRERMSSGEARRVGRHGTSALVTAALGLVALGLLAFLTTRYTHRFDWTEQQVHTLSDQTQKVLEGLEVDVSVTAFFNPQAAPPFRDLLDRYAYASERLSLEFADPNVRPDLVEDLALDGRDLARGLMRIAAGGDSVDLTQFDEVAITNAIVKLTRGGEKKVYFVEGHNERAIEGEAGGEGRGFARARGALENEAYAVEKLLLAATGEIPEDADVVVIAGPTRPLLDAEHAALGRYLEAGGALLVMLDPRSNSDLGDDLRSWGVEVGEDVVFDRSLALFGRATSPFAAEYADHPITRDLRETVLFHMARSVRATEDGGSDFTTLVHTGDASWAETDLAEWRKSGRAGYDEGADQLGPVPIAVVGTPRIASLENGADSAAADGGEPRLVVFGDADFASNELVDGFLNRDLFVNSVNWLMGDVQNIGVRPNKSRASRLQLSEGQFLAIQTLSLFVLPEAIAIGGVFAWWWRRKRPAA